MTTSGGRPEAQHLIFRLINGIIQTGAFAAGSAAQEVQEKGAIGSLRSAKQRIMETAIVSGPVKAVGSLTKLVSSIAGKFGIQFSIASIMKQSQIFTGALGSIFQILGAFVDVMLAPFMPMFTRLLQRMVTWIPLVQEKAEAAAAWLENAWFTSSGVVGTFLWKTIVKAFEMVPWGTILKKLFSMSPSTTMAAGVALAPWTSGLSIPFAAGIAATHPDTGRAAGRLARGAGGGAADSAQGYFDLDMTVEDESVVGITRSIWGKLPFTR